MADRLPLPSVAQLQGELPFILELTDEHRRQSGAKLEELAGVLNGSTARGDPLRIRLSHLEHPGVLVPDFFVMAIIELDGDGKQLEVMRPGGTLQLGVMLNSPVDVQVEAVLSYLTRFRRRQNLVKTAAEQSAILQVDTRAGETDRLADLKAVDLLRYGWRETARQLVNEWDDAGRAIKCVYENPLMDRSVLENRYPNLCEIYNRLPDVRDAVDRVVAAIGGREPRVITSGFVPEHLRRALQQNTFLSSISRYVCQVCRDSLVYGNGFMAAAPDEPLGVFAIRPEHAFITSAGGPVAVGASEQTAVATEGVTHIPGMKQVGSPYAISPLEVFMQDLQKYKVGEEATSDRRLNESATANDEVERWLAEVRDFHKRTEVEIRDHVRRILAPALDLARPEGSPYFPGCELA